MSDKRVVLAPDTDNGGDFLVEHAPRDGFELWFEPRIGEEKLCASLTEAEARHLARWLRDQGFLDEPAGDHNIVDGVCVDCGCSTNVPRFLDACPGVTP
jgi:hypothetical protein